MFAAIVIQVAEGGPQGSWQSLDIESRQVRDNWGGAVVKGPAMKSTPEIMQIPRTRLILDAMVYVKTFSFEIDRRRRGMPSGAMM